MTRAKSETESVTLRLERSKIERLDRIAAKIAKPGMRVSRTDAIKVVLECGFEPAEKLVGLKTK